MNFLTKIALFSLLLFCSFRGVCQPFGEETLVLKFPRTPMDSAIIDYTNSLLKKDIDTVFCFKWQPIGGYIPHYTTEGSYDKLFFEKAYLFYFTISHFAVVCFDNNKTTNEPVISIPMILPLNPLLSSLQNSLQHIYFSSEKVLPYTYETINAGETGYALNNPPHPETYTLITSFIGYTQLNSFQSDAFIESYNGSLTPSNLNSRYNRTLKLYSVFITILDLYHLIDSEFFK